MGEKTVFQKFVSFLEKSRYIHVYSCGLSVSSRNCALKAFPASKNRIYWPSRNLKKHPMLLTHNALSPTFSPYFVQVSESYLWVRYARSYKDEFLMVYKLKSCFINIVRSQSSETLSIWPIAFLVTDILFKFGFPKHFHIDEEFLRMSSCIICFTEGPRIWS